MLEPPQLSSIEGVLRVELHYRRGVDEDGRVHYCYVTATGLQNPTLRVRRGDWLILQLKNDLPAGEALDMPHPTSGAAAWPWAPP